MKILFLNQNRVQEKLLENNIQVTYPKYQSKKEEAMMFSPPQTKLRKKLMKNFDYYIYNLQQLESHNERSKF